MPKKDGPGNHRVEKGQPLSQAFTALGWNRAQDAADIVLGSSISQEAGPAQKWKYGFSVPLEFLAGYEPTEEIPLGSAFLITGYAAEGESTTNFQTATTEERIESKSIFRHLKGTLLKARTLGETETSAMIFPEPFGISTAPVMPGDTVVNVVVSGLAVARVRVCSSLHRYVSAPTDRFGQATPDGVLETSDTGYARAITVAPDTLTNYGDPDGEYCLIVL